MHAPPDPTQNPTPTAEEVLAQLQVLANQAAVSSPELSRWVREAVALIRDLRRDRSDILDRLKYWGQMKPGDSIPRDWLDQVAADCKEGAAEIERLRSLREALRMPDSGAGQQFQGGPIAGQKLPPDVTFTEFCDKSPTRKHEWSRGGVCMHCTVIRGARE